MRSLLSASEITDRDVYWKHIGAFWVRRFYRLVPASWLWLAISIILSILYNKSGIFGYASRNFTDFFAQLFYVANWHAYFCTKNVSTCGINGIYWSLSLEEQFYIFLPIAIFIFRKNTVWVCAALIVVQFPLDRPIFGAFWLTRLDAVCWGVILAYFSRTNIYAFVAPTALRSTSLRVIVVSLLVASMAVYAHLDTVPFYTGVIAVSGAILVWIASYDDGFLFYYLKNNRILLWIGARSYSIYLSHSISFYVVTEYCRRRSGSILSADDTFVMFFFGFGLTVVSAELCYRLVETPFRRRGRAVSERMTARIVE